MKELLPSPANHFLHSLTIPVSNGLGEAMLTEDDSEDDDDNDDDDEVFDNESTKSRSPPLCVAPSTKSLPETITPLTIATATASDTSKISSAYDSTSYTYFGGDDEKVPFHVRHGVKHVIVDESVTEIGEDAFFGFESLEAVMIIPPPAGADITAVLATIGDKAFAECKALSSIVIPNSVTSLGKGVFYGASSLARIEIPDSVVSIGVGAFTGCSSLEFIEISRNVSSIPKGAFRGCSHLESIEIPPFVTSIGEQAFAGCSSLRHIVIPDTVTSIGRGAFAECSSLESIVISDAVASIGSSTFSKCAALEHVVLPDFLNSIGDHAFDGCSSLASIAIPKSLTFIDKTAFARASSLKSMELPSTVTVTGVEEASVFAMYSMLEYAGTPDITKWLKTRFRNLQLHRVCYDPNVSVGRIKLCLAETFGAFSQYVDGLGMTALHILLHNNHPDDAMMIVEMIRVVIDIYPEAVTTADKTGSMPLHDACRANRNMSLSILKLLCERDTLGIALECTDKRNNLPCGLAIQRRDFSIDMQFHLFERFPIHHSQLNSSDEGHKAKLETLTKTFVAGLSPDSFQRMDSHQMHGWVQFLKIYAENEATTSCAILLRHIKEWPLEAVYQMAYCKDLRGRTAIETATTIFRTALSDRILFLGRYEMVALLHESFTSILIKALDIKGEEEYRRRYREFLKKEMAWSELDKNSLEKLLGVAGAVVEVDDALFETWDSDGDGWISEADFVRLCKAIFDRGHTREVVLKFMKEKSHFDRELGFREVHQLEARYVVSIENEHSLEPSSEYEDKLKPFCNHSTKVLRDYKYVFALSCADCDLDSILQHEYPNDRNIPAMAKEIAESILHLHESNLAHCDIKRVNVVRLGGRLRLIDLDASASMMGGFAGAKFSSGVLPPEMIARLNKDEKNKFECFFQDERGTKAWDKIKPKELLGGREFFAVKTFRGSDSNALASSERLPYTLIEATGSFDVWSFGVLLYSLYTRASLFEVNLDDDIIEARVMKELWEWNGLTKKAKLSNIKSPRARRLLEKALSKEPMDRFQSMQEMLNDDYFMLPMGEITEEENGGEKIDKARRTTKTSAERAKVEIGRDSSRKLMWLTKKSVKNIKKDESSASGSIDIGKTLLSKKMGASEMNKHENGKGTAVSGKAIPATKKRPKGTKNQNRIKPMASEQVIPATKKKTDTGMERKDSQQVSDTTMFVLTKNEKAEEETVVKNATSGNVATGKTISGPKRRVEEIETNDGQDENVTESEEEFMT